MPFSEAYHRRPSWRETLIKGALIGFSGGLAEIAFICTYMTASGLSPAPVARAIAEAAHLGGSAAAGIAVHMILSLLLGSALVTVWISVRNPRPKASAAYLFMMAALIVIWSFNFLVLLPSLDPDFADLLPYSASFSATLCFALVGAPMLESAVGQPTLPGLKIRS